MTMNNRFFVSLLLGALPLTMMAQDDDMYFVPSKKSVEQPASNSGRRGYTYYSGSNRSVDEYNRRGTGGSYYQVLPADTTGNDIISFSAERGVFPDSTATEDYALTRQMARYDGYDPGIAYAEGYRDGRTDSWTWHSPWYYSSYYPWYDSYWYWNDPWYYRHYGWYSTWYDPWYYDRYYWYGPRYYGGYYGGHYYRSGRSAVFARNGNTGSIDRRGNTHGRFTGGSRSVLSTTNRATPSTSRSGNFSRSTTTSRSGNFSRSTSTTSNSGNFSRSTSSFGSSSSGSFSRSSGGGSFSSGGSRSGGGGGGGIGRAGRR